MCVLTEGEEPGLRAAGASTEQKEGPGYLEQRQCSRGSSKTAQDDLLYCLIILRVVEF